MDDRTVANELHNGSTQSSLACKSCRRKKLKCDRSVPQCRNCMKVSRDCEYPAVAQKPGPRPGTHRRAVGVSKHSGIVTKDAGSSAAKDARSPDTFAGSMASRTGNHVNGHTSAQPVPALLNRESASTTGSAFRDACATMQMSEQTCWVMIRIFFDNITSFSLFHQPTFSTKLASIQSEKEVRALLLSMFIFSIRFLGDDKSVFGPDVTSRTILEVAYDLSHECLRDCSEETPPLHLLQSFILQALSLSNYRVQGRSWRLVGQCVRIAYQLRLHEVDVEPFTTDIPSQRWVANEEQRRAWWAVWECDVFAASILRLPVGVDWTRNRTCLPSCNEAWFDSIPVRSCWFNVDPNKRWRGLRDSGNTSELAWFILVNSYKWEALAVSQRIAPPTTFFDDEEQLRDRFGAKDYKPVTQRRREMLENCLRCAMNAIPPILQTNGYLSFQPSPPPYPIINLARDCGRYMLQIMNGVTLLLLARKDLEAGQYIAFPTDLSLPIPSANSAPTTSTPHEPKQKHQHQHQRRWQRCLLEADKIAQTVRNTSPNYHRYMNANAATALWMAAAAQHAVLAYHRDEIDVDYAHSNLDVLTTTMESFVRFWDVPETLVQSLSTLETRLKGMVHSVKAKQSRASKGGDHPAPPQSSTSSTAVEEEDDSNTDQDPPTNFNTITTTTTDSRDSTTGNNANAKTNTNTAIPPLPTEDTTDLSPFDVLQAMDFGAMYNGIENWENLFLDPGFPQAEAGVWY